MTDQPTAAWWFVDPIGVEPGSALWWLMAGVEMVLTLGAPIMAAGIVAPLVALWVERRHGR